MRNVRYILDVFIFVIYLMPIRNFFINYWIYKFCIIFISCFSYTYIYIFLIIRFITHRRNIWTAMPDFSLYQIIEFLLIWFGPWELSILINYSTSTQIHLFFLRVLISLCEAFCILIMIRYYFIIYDKSEKCHFR